VRKFRRGEAQEAAVTTLNKKQSVDGHDKTTAERYMGRKVAP